jgi:ABC-type transport system substrate-binding protein
LAYFDGIIISPKAIEKAKTKKGKKWVKNNPIGTGPFKFVKHERDVILEYKKFDGYWQKGKPYLDGIEFHFINENETALLAFKAKEAHAMKNVPLHHASDLEKQGYKLVGYPGGKFAMAPDSGNPDSIFVDRRIREAVEYALDREAMSKTLSFGYWRPLNHYASSESDAYMPGFKGRPYNPEKAKQLLKEAGYPNGFKTTIYGVSWFPVAMDTMVAVQSYLKKVGINAKVDIVDGGKYSQLQFGGWKNGLLMFGLGVNFHSATDLYRTFRTGARRLPSLGRLPELDKIFKEAVGAPDDEAQKVLVQKAVRRMHDTAMLTPLWVWHTIVAMDPSLRDMRFGENFGHSYTPANGWFAN